jgi:ribosomal protein S18 acetylase RimI-like enzyme
MSDIKILTEKYKEYLSEKNLEEIVDGFIAYHKSKYPKYGKDAETREYYIKTLKESVNSQKNEENKLLCLAYDTEAKRTIGLAYGGKVDDERWSLWFLYIQKNFRGKMNGSKRISEALYETFEDEVRKRGGKTLGLGVYCKNDEALRFYRRNGYELKPNFYQSKINILKSMNSLLEEVNKKKREKLGMELLDVEKSLI